MGKLKRIHVNQHKIKSNKNKNPLEREPVISIKSGKTNTYAHEVVITGPCKLVYSPDKPLSCGATVWIETDSDVWAMSNVSLDHANGVSLGT